MKPSLLHNHYQLVTIVEAYVRVYQDDLKNTSLQTTIIQTLQEAKEIQKGFGWTGNNKQDRVSPHPQR
jgi:hypothetical protein